jgi:hypothetical protein
MRPGKFDDRQIESGALANIGKEIAARVQKVRAYEAAASEKAGVELQKALDHRDAIAKLLVEAKAKCRGLGFKVFKEKYCPDFGRSKIYQLLQIGRGDTTADEIRETKRTQKREERAVAVRDTDNVADNSRDARKAVPKPHVTESPEDSAGLSASARLPSKAEHADLALSASSEALAEFKLAVDRLLPKMNLDDLTEAHRYALHQHDTLFHDLFHVARSARVLN